MPLRFLRQLPDLARYRSGRLSSSPSGPCIAPIAALLRGAGPFRHGGSSGRIGAALSKTLTELDLPVEPASWLDPKTKRVRDQRDVLAQLSAIEGGADIISPSGLTDPSASAADLALANVERPGRCDQGCDRPSAFRYLTIGSVLKTLSGLAARNRYLASKTALWARVEELAADPRLDGRFTCTCADIPFTAAHRRHICSWDRCTTACARGSTFPNERGPAATQIRARQRCRIVDHRVMTRYKGRQNAKAVEQDFPHSVEISVPPGGLGSRLDAMYEFHERHGIPARRGRHDANGSVVRWCFADPACCRVRQGVRRASR